MGKLRLSPWRSEEELEGPRSTPAEGRRVPVCAADGQGRPQWPASCLGPFHRRETQALASGSQHSESGWESVSSGSQTSVTTKDLRGV